MPNLLSILVPVSKTSDDIVMKLGPVTKLDKRNKTTSKNFDNEFMP